jgi:prepilin-type N-terminal cleavage/methylation domain-containing protein/prepilin-type processing-associated H-X9-DG protein
MTLSHRRGFTLRELLVVVTILCLLAGLILPALQLETNDGRRINCLNNVRQIAVGGNHYATRMQYLPSSRSWASKSLGPNGNFPGESAGDPEKLAYTWVQPLLPYLDRADMVAELTSTPQAKQPSYGRRVDVLMCPSDTHDGEGPGVLDYAINAGRANCDGQWKNHDWKANGGSHDALRRMQDSAAFRRNRMTSVDLVDGASVTIAFAENFYLRTWSLDPTAKPPVAAITEFHSGIIWDPSVSSFPKLPPHNSSVDRSGGVSHGSTYAHPSSRHPGGFNMAMWDGSAKFVSNSIDYTVYARLMSSDGKRTRDPCTTVFEGPTPVWQASDLSEGEW